MLGGDRFMQRVFRLGIFTSASLRTFQTVMPMLDAAAGARLFTEQCFHLTRLATQQARHAESPPPSLPLRHTPRMRCLKQLLSKALTSADKRRGLATCAVRASYGCLHRRSSRA